MTNYWDRIVATQGTKDAFEGRVFAYGHADCLILVHDHLTRCGYDLPVLPSYRGAKAAGAALAAQGAESLEDLVSQYLQAIPPAFMLPGDILAAPGKPFAALSICSGPMLFGWSEGYAHIVNFSVPADVVLRAWRVEIKTKVGA